MVAEGFVVFDLETTGFSPLKNDRIVEIGLVHVSRAGEITHRWDTMINPDRDLGPTRIHGIRGADVVSAPSFEGIADELRDLLANRVPVAHNASFDVRFLESEWHRAGLTSDPNFTLNAMCTMQLASRLLPGSSRSLSDCCSAFDIRIDRAHSALGDAEATASLLSQFFKLPNTEQLWESALLQGFDSTLVRSSGRQAHRRSRSVVSLPETTSSDDFRRIDSIVSSLPDREGATEAERNYLALLDRCLSDFELSNDELDQLGVLASESGLDRKTRRRLESQYLEQIVAVAKSDGHVSDDERGKIELFGRALGFSDHQVMAMIDSASIASTEGDSSSSDMSEKDVSIEPGSMVVLTGDMERSRSAWIENLTASGFSIHPAVTKNVDLVVAEDVHSLSGKAKKARSYGIPIVSEKRMEEHLNSRRSTAESASPQSCDRQLLVTSPYDAPATSKTLEEELIGEFVVELPGNLKGIGFETFSAGNVKVIIFYRRELNYALVHNNVGIIAGIGIKVDESDRSELSQIDGSNRSVLSGFTATMRSGRFDSDRSLTIAPIRIEPGQKRWFDQRTVNWALDTDAFLSLDEAVPETLDIAVDIDGQKLERTISLRMLAHNQWTPRSIPETIAAFVRPRSEAVGELLSVAADLLEQRTGDPSIAGYQLGTDRVIATAEAIYDAVKRFGIRYSEPPSSFESEGQKVRTSDVVVAAKFGTCLDLAVFVAAALEEAGIQSFIVFPPGHALVGFSVRELSTDTAFDDEGSITNLFGSQVFVPIETTAATVGKEVSFKDAVESGFEHSGFGRNVQSVVNVLAAHRRIMPLPTIAAVDGVPTIVHIEERRSAEQKYVEVVAESEKVDGNRLTLKKADSPRRVQRWQSELLDLSLRNPLLKLGKARGVKILLPELELSELEDRLAQNEPVELTPDDVVEAIDLEQGILSASDYPAIKRSRLFREERRVFVKSDNGKALSKLTALRRDAKNILEETGANALYLSIGLMRWQLSGAGAAKKEALSPLFLLPVELTGSTTRPYSIRVEPNSELQPNHCLIEKLRLEHGLSLPQLIEPPSDDSGIDVERVFVELRKTFIERGLPFSIEADARLAIIKFSSLDMWRDVSENWNSLIENRFVNHLINSSGDLIDISSEVPAVGPDDEVSRFLPLPADGTQLEAIIASSEAESFVLEGPPGTGKSQTITNMIADGIARDRTILFVAEKQAALSVVYDRLKRVGLKPLVLNVHGVDQTVNAVRAQLKSALQAKSASNRAVFDAKRLQLKAIISDLQIYPAAVHSSTNLGHTIWESFQKCAFLEREFPAESAWSPEDIPVSPELAQMEPLAVRELCTALSHASLQSRGHRLPAEWRIVGPAFELRPISDGSVGTVESTVDRLVNTTRSLIVAFDQLPKELRELLDRLDSTQLSALKKWIIDLDDRLALIPRWLNSAVDRPELVQAKLDDLRNFKTHWGPFASTLADGALKTPVDTLLNEYEEARRAGMLSRKRLVRLASDKILARFDIRIAAQVEQDPIRHLTQLREFQHSERSLRMRMGAAHGVQSGRSLFDQSLEHDVAADLDRTRDFAYHSQILRDLLIAAPEAVEQINSLGERFHPSVMASGSNTLSSRLKEFEESWRGMTATAVATPGTLTHWMADCARLERINECRSRWSEDISESANHNRLERLLRFQALLGRIRDLGMARVAEEIDAGKSAEFLAEAIILAVNRYRLDQLMKESDLEVFNSATHARQVADYVKLSRELKELTQTELPAQLLERRKNFSASVGLRKQLDRKRGGSIRTLFRDYGAEIMKITPVVLMSPSSVARALPIDAVRFDSVIFDEASQVKVADAVGAIGRASSVVIVGDSQQMPPSSTFGSNASDDEDNYLFDDLSSESSSLLRSSSESTSLLAFDTTDQRNDDSGIALATTIDQESILSEAVNTGVPRRWLQWHYRSQHDSLISFSNAKYYEGKLQVFPPPPVADPTLGVSTRFVGGEYDRGKTRTNAEEAMAVVEYVENLISRNNDVSIGVVTFNTQQRDLILDLLEGSDNNDVRKSLDRVHEPLFVKNLDSVQGDERDIILFSIAFAKDRETGRLSLNFGPLNNAGGERRLNVAITRARRTVILFTSLRSEDIDRSRTKSQGLIDLREYLAAAERGEAFNGTDLEHQASHDEFRDQVAINLEQRGLEVVTDIGTSGFRIDLAARASEDHGWIAIILDSPEWAARRMTSDRESLPTTILEGILGWDATELVLLADWINDRNQVVGRLNARAESLVYSESFENMGTADELTVVPVGSYPVAEAVDTEGKRTQELDEVSSQPAGIIGSAGIEDSTVHAELGASLSFSRGLSELAPMTSEEGPAQSDPEVQRPSPLNDPDEFSQRNVDMSGEYEFVPADREQVGETTVLDKPKIKDHRERLQIELEKVISTEGPIEASRAARIVGNRFGLSRVSESRKRSILSVSQRTPMKGSNFGDFFWPDSLTPDTYSGYRISSDHVENRVVTEIGHIEIGNAMLSVVSQHQELDTEDLIRETMDIFGWTRKGKIIHERLSGVLEWLIEEGRVEKLVDSTVRPCKTPSGDRSQCSSGGGQSEPVRTDNVSP